MSDEPLNLDDKPREKHPIDEEFFESLWPLILDENPCRVKSKSEEFFVPEKPFNQLHWHTFLSKVGYPGYERPHELRCCGAARKQEESERQAVQLANMLAMFPTPAALANFQPERSRRVRPVDKQVDHLRHEQERRQKLAYKFANRQYPWTMQTPSHELGFALTPQLLEEFPCKMEQEILEGIHHYNINFMLIDAGNEVCADDFKRWVKFRPYVQMLVTVRCPRVERHLQLLKVFQTMIVEEDITNTWHKELESSLYTGLKEAKARGLYKTCADAFVFVFSRYRGICTCDTYKVLRRM